MMMLDYKGGSGRGGGEWGGRGGGVRSKIKEEVIT